MKKLVLLWTAAVFVPACTCAVNLEPLKFACAQDSECGPGHLCRSGECAPVGGSGGGGGGGMQKGCGTGAVESCTDRADNDCDGLIDCGDPTCSGGDLSDNDCDALVDCADPSCELRSCGAFGQGCSVGACVCSGNGGAIQASESNCTDGFDNDCDGQADCLDPSCDVKACGANGRMCVAMMCACAPDGGTPQTVEVCNDVVDNDCDGTSDCADSDCDAQVCGANGRACSGTTCASTGNGGTVQVAETLCGDTRDNDCDGQVDCSDAQCNTLSCGANGRVCNGVTCACSGNGGAAQANETTCGDTRDNDCDGLADCADTQCNGLSCGANGRTCAGTACTCSGNGAPPQVTETTCNDTRDNDCDGLVDCADTQCSGQVCGANGRSCSGTTCACSGNGGTAQSFESLCSDTRDNDCDALTDCADTTCEGRSCGAGCLCIGALKAEVTCSGGVDDDADGQTDCADADCGGRSCGAGCVCSGGLPVETLCTNAIDDDADGLADCTDTNCCVGCPITCEQTCNDNLDEDGNLLIDCADSKCSGRACGVNGRVCNGASCACSGNGGIAQTAETSCFDGFDNDCDGLIDCADPNCQAQPCTCEVNCRDGVDNDCNGTTDCADAKCLRKPCSTTSAASVCCSTQANAVACKNLAADEFNCGGCGLACATNRFCVAATSGTTPSGRCDCTNSMQCPSTQTCGTNCSCSSSLSCASGQTCTSSVCAYP